MKIDEKNTAKIEINNKLKEAEKDIREGNLHDSEEVFAALKRKYFSK